MPWVTGSEYERARTGSQKLFNGRKKPLKKIDSNSTSIESCTAWLSVFE